MADSQTTKEEALDLLHTEWTLLKAQYDKLEEYAAVLAEQMDQVASEIRQVEAAAEELQSDDADEEFEDACERND